MQVPPWLKPGIWGAVIGAVAMVTVGFAQFGWKTGSAAESLAQERADVAVASALVPFCIAKAQQASASDSLAKFQTASSWSRTEIVRTAGWATLDGMASPDSALARACSDRLGSLTTG
jgi:hypothetical protein